MSPVPVAENFPLTTQKKVRSAGHWNLLSRDVVEQTLASLQQAGATPQSTIHVPLPPNASEFERTFHDFLITDLVQQGWRVQPDHNNAMLTLSYQSQIVRHNSERPSSINTGGPTHTELILTTTVTSEGRYLSRKTDVYYLEESDASLFYGPYRNPAIMYGRNMKVVAE